MHARAHSLSGEYISGQSKAESNEFEVRKNSNANGNNLMRLSFIKTTANQTQITGIVNIPKAGKHCRPHGTRIFRYPILQRKNHKICIRGEYVYIHLLAV